MEFIAALPTAGEINEESMHMEKIKCRMPIVQRLAFGLLLAASFGWRWHYRSAGLSRHRPPM